MTLEELRWVQKATETVCLLYEGRMVLARQYFIDMRYIPRLACSRTKRVLAWPEKPFCLMSTTLDHLLVIALFLLSVYPACPYFIANNTSFIFLSLILHQCNMSHPCEARCGRWFATAGSMNSHLTSARSCAWYIKGKLRDLALNDAHDLNIPAPPPPFEPQEDDDWGNNDPGQGDDWGNYDPEQDDDIDIDFGPYGDEFLPPNEPEVGVAGPGPQTAENRILQGAAKTRHPVLDDDDDAQVIQIDEDAGRIYRQDPPPKHFQVDKDGDSLMDSDNLFFPFSSELDWRVAQWAIKDGPGHNAFNRLLEIPGVSSLIDFFSMSDLILGCRKAWAFLSQYSRAPPEDRCHSSKGW